MSGLLIASPLAISDAMLTATDVTEADYTAWNAATAYALADRCIRTASGTHKIYERLVPGTTATAPESDATNWIEVSPTNRWKLFDASNSTATAKATSLYYEITPGVAINTVFAGGIVGATSIRVRLTDATYGVVYDSGTVSLAGLPPAADPWAFCFGVWTGGVSTHTITELPAFPAAVLRVDLAGDATLAIGVLLLAAAVEFGEGIQYGARAGIQDYSRKQANDWGDLVLVERAYAKRASFTLLLTTEEIDSLQDYLAAIRATACLYIGYSAIGALSVFGFFKNFEISIAYPTRALCDFEVEGLT
jgi:hypothetical protein